MRIRQGCMDIVGEIKYYKKRRRHTRWNCDWSSDVCSSDLCAENKISGSNFVPESFTDLGDSERNSHPGSIQNASEIHKHCLGSFRPEVSSIRRLFCRADKCFKHQVKHPFSCKRIFCSAARTNPFTDLICPEPSVAFFTFHQRICKVCNVAGCLPNFWIHNQSRINPHNILPKLNKPFPPSLFRSEEHT